MSNLPRDLVEEVISRVPATSLRNIRSTCKKWNTLSSDGSFTENHLAQAAATSTEKKESLAIVLINYSLHYPGQTQWIYVEPAYPIYFHHRLRLYGYVLGYNESKKSHKILRFAYAPSNLEKSVQEIYDLNSNSWRVLDEITSEDDGLGLLHAHSYVPSSVLF